MNEKCEIVFILDRSGSMHHLENDTIGGFNSMIDKQKEEGIDGVVSVALFDHELEIPFDRVDLKDIPELTNKIYFTRGNTALYDAVGNMIQRVLNHRRFLNEAEIPSRTLFVITTDGYENASREFSGPALRKLIEKQKEADWEFLYLGANIDAAVEAEKIGIGPLRAATYNPDSVGIKKNFKAVADAIPPFLKKKRIDDNWADEIHKDFKERKSSH